MIEQILEDQSKGFSAMPCGFSLSMLMTFLMLLPCAGLKFGFLLRCVTNGEPLLVSGVLLQLGGKLVVKASAEKIVDPAVAAAACVKIAVYHDSVLGSWQDVVSQPD